MNYSSHYGRLASSLSVGYGSWKATKKKKPSNKLKSFRAKTVQKSDYKTIYTAYLSSECWKRTRARMLKKYPCCQECSSVFTLQVHHKTYDRVGHELEEDLIVLCRNCHKAEHGL